MLRVTVGNPARFQRSKEGHSQIQKELFIVAVGVEDWLDLSLVSGEDKFGLGEVACYHSHLRLRHASVF